MTFGGKLAKLRREKNYTQEQFADILGVSRQSVSKWESDLAYPETDKLVKICELFNCSSDYLLLNDKDGITLQKPQFEDGEQSEQTDTFEIRVPPIKDRKSKRTLWGLPLWHVAKNAKGIIAIGVKARGIIAVGAITFGVFSLGAVAIGDVSVGALAVGRYVAIGDNARAMIAVGGHKSSGEVFQHVGKLTAELKEQVKMLVDQTVPAYLSWAAKLVKSILS